MVGLLSATPPAHLPLRGVMAEDQDGSTALLRDPLGAWGGSNPRRPNANQVDGGGIGRLSRWGWGWLTLESNRGGVGPRAWEGPGGGTGRRAARRPLIRAAGSVGRRAAGSEPGDGFEGSESVELDFVGECRKVLTRLLGPNFMVLPPYVFWGRKKGSDLPFIP